MDRKRHSDSCAPMSILPAVPPKAMNWPLEADPGTFCPAESTHTRQTGCQAGAARDSVRQPLGILRPARPQAQGASAPAGKAALVLQGVLQLPLQRLEGDAAVRLLPLVAAAGMQRSLPDQQKRLGTCQLPIRHQLPCC